MPKHLNFYLPDTPENRELWADLKVLAAEERRPMYELAAEALKEKLEKSYLRFTKPAPKK